MIDKNCPCTKDCPDRNPSFCPTCEKFKIYRAEKQKEYDKHKQDFEFRVYESSKWNGKHQRARNFKKGTIK